MLLSSHEMKTLDRTGTNIFDIFLLLLIVFPPRVYAFNIAGVEAKLHNTICYRLSNEVFTAEETPFPEMEIIDPPDTVTPHEEEQGHKVNC